MTDLRSPSINGHPEPLSPPGEKQLKHDSYLKISQMQQRREEIVQQHAQTTNRIDDKIKLLRLSLGSNSPAGNETVAIHTADETSSSPPRPLLKSSSSAGANTLVDREYSSSREVSLDIKQGEEGDDDLAFLHMRDGSQSPQMSDAIMAPFDPGHESRNNTVGSHGQSSRTLSKRKRHSTLLSFKKQRTTELVAGDDHLLPQGDVDMTDVPNRLGNLANAQTRLPPSPKPFTQRLSQLLPHFVPVFRNSRVSSRITACVDITPEMSVPSELNSERPSSWPRARQWRRSFGVSVKELRDNFEH